MLDAARRYPSPAVWRVDADGQLRARRHDDPGAVVAWAPQSGSQVAFLQCSTQEVLYAGPKGFGKTQALLVDFARSCGLGWGGEWRGILFRRSFPELKDVESKALDLFPRAFPAARYNRSSHEWRWPDGETLILSYMDHSNDWRKHFGHAYPWVGFEELTAWPDDEGYTGMFGCLRSSHVDVAKSMRVRATTNPEGPGHNWVKRRFELPIQGEEIVGPLIRAVDDKGNALTPRRAIRGTLDENLVMLRATPNYLSNLRVQANSKAKHDAWIGGSWDIVSGGMFDDLWDAKVHVISPALPWQFLLEKAPGWRIDRTYDHGQTKPFSVGWWAQSNGEPIEWGGRRLGEVRGDVFRVDEWYGWDGHENHGLNMSALDIAREIARRETEWKLRGTRPERGPMGTMVEKAWKRCRPGPADTSIWNSDATSPNVSVAGIMEGAKTPQGASASVAWERADKGPGSRKLGWEVVREYLRGAVPGPDGTREKPGLFVSAACKQFIRTVPVLPRDVANMDDVDTEAEDHVADEVRYRLRRPRAVASGASHLLY